MGNMNGLPPLDQIDSEAFGAALHAARKRAGLTMDAAAERVGARSASQLLRWETGERVPSFFYVTRIAYAFPSLSVERQAALLFGRLEE
tara:strand:+ start:326 stop:592 length:267 start_codon:yes stop_codon:yes gene_type:complete